MRLSKLQLENFKAIVSAELELGPGLNVLYGPNDLGKSTLGVALRAALLLPSTSSAASEFVPWQEQVAPVVTLTFLTDAARHWRVVKRFTENDATLAFSKDGREFSVDAHERQVDERLRKLLGWGVPPPGGRAGARGMPESFIANALLAGQTDVDAILGASLEKDLDPSGKLKLTAALSALAQDPLVRHVLDRAQKEHELHFTATGRKRGGQSAPLALASEQVKKLTDELVAQQQALSQSSALEEEAGRLNSAWLAAQQHAEQAEQQLKRAQAGLSRATEKRLAEQKLAVEKQALAQLDALEGRVLALGVEVDSCAAQVKERSALLKPAQAAVKQANQVLKDAEAAHTKALSADGEAARTVARAALTEEQARHSMARAELTSRLEKAKAQAKANETLTSLTETQRKLTAQLAPARARHTEAESEAAMASALMNYGHWRLASEAASSAQKWRAEAKKLRAEALEKTSEAMRVQEGAKQLEDEVTARRAELPDERARTNLARLRRELELAEAALGGGVTVVVKPRAPILFRSTADENEPEAEKKISRELSIEADRRVLLGIGDLVELEVLAGAADKRKDAEHLKKKWKSEGLPVLERANVRTLSELDEVFAQLGEQLERAKAIRQTGAKAESEAASLRERAAMLDEKAAGAPSVEQLEERKLAVGSYPLERLAPVFDAMGASWESQARPLHEKKSAALAEAAAVLKKLEGELELTEHRLTDAREKLPGTPEDVTKLERALAELDQALAKVQEKLEQLEQEGTGQRKLSAAKVEEAKQKLAESEAALAAVTEALEAARAAESERKGQRDGAAAQLEEAKREEVLARVKAAEAALAKFQDVEVLTAEQLEQLEREVDRLRGAAEQAGRDFANAEGALSKVGGPQAREQVRQLEEAVLVARARERSIEVDAAGWRLLMEAVREAEKEDSSSLGSALAVPVTQRFAELTGGRYPTVKFGPTLAAAGVELPGIQSSPSAVLEALSVGTKDHLATLVRLAIALQLKSAIVLDDHLVHSDPARLGWFRDALQHAAKQTQVVVLTCRPLDYVTADALPKSGAMRDVEGTRVIDLAKVINRRGAPSPSGRGSG